MVRLFNGKRGVYIVNIKDFSVGQEVVIVTDRKRHLKSYTSHKEVVVGIGRKYVKTVRPEELERKVDKKYWFAKDFYSRNETDPFLVENRDWGDVDILFPSEQALADWREREELNDWFDSQFKYGTSPFSLEQLREAKKILDTNSC